jgi:hypothetical protein
MSSTPAATPSLPANNNNDGGLSSGAKAGIGAGVAAGVLATLLVVALVYIFRQRSKKKNSAALDQSGAFGQAHDGVVEHYTDEGGMKQHMSAAPMYGSPPMAPPQEMDAARDPRELDGAPAIRELEGDGAFPQRKRDAPS